MHGADRSGKLLGGRILDHKPRGPRRERPLQIAGAPERRHDEHLARTQPHDLFGKCLTRFDPAGGAARTYASDTLFPKMIGQPIRYGLFSSDHHKVYFVFNAESMDLLFTDQRFDVMVSGYSGVPRRHYQFMNPGTPGKAIRQRMFPCTASDD